VPLILTPTASLLADRMSRRTIMVAADVRRAALCVALAALTRQAGATVAILALTILSAIFTSLFSPARLGLLAQVVGRDKRMALNVANGLMGTLSLTLAPALVGTIMLSAGAYAMFLVNAATFLFSAACVLALWPMRRGETGEASGETEIGKSWTSALTFIYRNRAVGLALVVHELSHFVVGASFVAMVVLAARTFAQSNAGVGYLVSAIGVGSVLDMVAGGVFSRQRSMVVAAGSVVLLGLTLMAFGSAGNAVVALVVCVGLGLFATILEPPIWTTYQDHTPEEAQGRVFGIIDTATTSGIVAGSSIRSILLDAFGLRVAMLVCGGAVAILAASTIGPLLGEFRSAPATDRVDEASAVGSARERQRS